MVAPPLGAWLETMVVRAKGSLVHLSLPSWERGLKLTTNGPKTWDNFVAPLVGAWIET